jgi:hypothetical protein
LVSFDMLINDWLLRTAPHDMRERLFLVFDVSKIFCGLATRHGQS